MFGMTEYFSPVLYVRNLGEEMDGTQVYELRIGMRERVGIFYVQYIKKEINGKEYTLPLLPTPIKKLKDIKWVSYNGGRIKFYTEEEFKETSAYKQLKYQSLESFRTEKIQLKLNDQFKKQIIFDTVRIKLNLLREDQKEAIRCNEEN